MVWSGFPFSGVAVAEDIRPFQFIHGFGQRDERDRETDGELPLLPPDARSGAFSRELHSEQCPRLAGGAL